MLSLTVLLNFVRFLFKEENPCILKGKFSLLLTVLLNFSTSLHKRIM